MSELSPKHYRRRGHRLFIVAVTAVLTMIAVNWAWNGAGVTIFSLPEAKFAHLASVIIAIIAMLVLARIVIRGANSSYEP